MSKCKECKYFDPQFNDCKKDNHYTYSDDESCNKFEKRKECKFKYENCDINSCSIICHKTPSECGCDFYYECTLDDRYCDERCEEHKDRQELNILNKERCDLVKAKESIEKSIKRYDEKIKEIEEKLNKNKGK